MKVSMLAELLKSWPEAEIELSSGPVNSIIVHTPSNDMQKATKVTLSNIPGIEFPAVELTIRRE